MGNMISFNHRVTKDDDSLTMSNGLTDVLLDYLLLSGAKLAQTESEKRMTVFLGEKVQSCCGIGTVGFAITDMPWHPETFAADRSFLLHMTARARALTLQPEIHALLGYVPRKEHINYALDGFAALIARMTAADIQPEKPAEWLARATPDHPIYQGYPKCRRHGILLSSLGCKICIDQSGKYPVMPEDIEHMKHLWYGDAAPQGADTNESTQ